MFEQQPCRQVPDKRISEHLAILHCIRSETRPLRSRILGALSGLEKFQKFPCFHLAVARDLQLDPLMEKCIHVLNQRGDLAQDKEGNPGIL